MPDAGTAWLIAAGLGLGAYLCGAIPFGLIVGLVRGIDIRSRGSRNIGATNAGRVLGKPWGMLVFALDLLKGFGPVVLCRFALTSPSLPWFGHAHPWLINLVWITVAVLAVLGHMFPVYLRFRGGKGVATSLGVGLAIYPYYVLPGLMAFACWGLILAVTRYVSVASIGAVIAFPILFAVLARVMRHSWGGLEQLWPLHVFSMVIAALVVFRHRNNIGRLLAGTEPKVGASSEPTK